MQEPMTQVGGQESPSAVLPSSHVSPFCRMPSPHTAGAKVQLVVQKSVLTAFPSSHCSTPWWVNPSPQRAFLQPATQASVLMSFPSSHCSAPSRMPLPHTAEPMVVVVVFVVVLVLVVGPTVAVVEVVVVATT